MIWTMQRNFEYIGVEVRRFLSLHEKENQNLPKNFINILLISFVVTCDCFLGKNMKTQNIVKLSLEAPVFFFEK